MAKRMCLWHLSEEEETKRTTNQIAERGPSQELGYAIAHRYPYSLEEFLGSEWEQAPPTQSLNH